MGLRILESAICEMASEVFVVHQKHVFWGLSKSKEGSRIGLIEQIRVIVCCFIVDLSEDNKENKTCNESPFPSILSWFGSLWRGEREREREMVVSELN